MAEFCYNPLKGVDDAISKAIGEDWMPFMVAGYRGLYDERNDVPLPMENPAKAAALLKEFALQLQEEDKRKVYKSIIQGAFDRKSSRQVLPQMYQQLKRDFSAQERFDRVSMIATMFSDRVDEILSEHPDLNRRSVINGIQHGKGIVGGEMGIFDAVYDELADYYAEAVNDGNTEDAEKYKKMLEHWPALSSYARIRLRDVEGVKLGKLVDYADDADESNYGDNDLSELFDASEAKREGWQEMNDYISAFGSIGKETRRVLGTIQQTDDKSNPEVDDLGFPRFLDPVQAHQTLMERLRGVTSESEMIRELQEGGKVEGWMNEVVDILQENPILRTQFYVDFHKNFQPYSTMIEEVKGGVRNFKTKILNKIENALAGEYSTRISLGISLSPNSLFDSRGNVNWANLKAFMDKVDEWLPVQTSDNVLSTPKFWKASPVERKAFLREAFNALGIPVDGNTFSRVVSDNRDLRKVTKSLQDLVNYGVRKVLTKEQLAALSAGEYNSTELGTKKFKSEIVRAKRESQSQKEGVVEENINKILTVITKNKEGLRLEHRVRKKDRNGRSTSMDSNVNPSYLGDFVAKIQSFVKANDKAGLQAWLQSKFLDSSYFMDNGQILNKWIEDLFNGGLGEDSFAANFSFERFLGTIDNNFEDFTSKQHAIALLSAYFSDKQISPKSQYAHYPVFILGDSGVAKWIKAKRYSSQEILNGMYNVYRQERRRMELTKAANEFLEDKGYKGIDNFSSKENEYTLLSFLNKDFKDFNGEPTTKYRDLMGENPTEQSVKRAIRVYMDDALANYKQRLKEFGVLEESDGKLVYLSQEATPATLDKVLAEYYWNTKFATIQQLQLMTIDPAFYKGTKDLQKRYKEIHAPGKSLSVEATWNGQGFTDSEGRAIERAVYFDDISIDAEESNPEFMAAIKARLPQVYKAYKDNTLTDGQGYRTLDSYRKVKIMAGEWTPEMEGVYNDIKGLKAKYAGEIPADALQEIADRAVVFQPIKPYMFTLENLNMGTDVLKIPVQHKYAEAVIIPELLPVGSKLRDLGEWMQEKDIDLVGSTKIVKVGGFGSADIKGQSGQGLRDALDKGYVHQLNYADYRIQSNVPEHVNHAQLFGTQVRKLIMANVRMDSYDYGKYIPSETVNLGDPSGPRRINGRNLVAFYNSLIVANILESYRQFAGEVGSKKKLSDMLSQSILGNSRESMDNLEAFSLTEDGDFTLPLFEGALEHDSSAMLFSLFKKMVNKQKISGGAAVQVSAYGLTTEEDGDLKYVTDGNDNILYAECEIPWDLSYTDRNGNVVALNFEDYCNPDGTLKMLENGESKLETEFPGITSLIAYRIPTERDYSMINLRVKRFSPKVAGGTIKIPAQGTTIAGFDFDIDKLYFMRREFREKKGVDTAAEDLVTAMFGGTRVREFDTYDYSKTPLENSRVARNNQLIDLIQQRLMDPETFAQRYTPGGFAQSSRAARVMREILFGSLDGIERDGKVDFDAINERAKDKKSDPEPNYDPSDPLTVITYNQQNQVAGKLIGIFANQNTNHAFSSLMKSFMLKAPIAFAGHSYSDLLHAPQGVDVDLHVAELLSASVDAVKDPVLNFLNLNTVTADAGAILARLGYTPTEIGILFNQPIIKEVCESVFNDNVDVDIAIGQLERNYKRIAPSYNEKEIKHDRDYSLDVLASNLITDRKARERGERSMANPDFVKGQLQVLKLFKDILRVSRDVSQFVTSSKFTASNAVGSSFGDLYAQQMKVQKYLDRFDAKGKDELSVTMQVATEITAPISNSEELLGLSDTEYMRRLLENPLGYEQAMYDANRKALRALSQFFPYETAAYKNARTRLAQLTRGQTLDAATINSMHSDMIVYMLSQQEGGLFDGNSTYVRNHDGQRQTMTRREYYTQHFAKDLFVFLENNPELKERPIFKYLQFNTEEQKGKEDKVTMNIEGVGGLASYQKEEIRDSWAELLEDFPQIADDLLLYNFYKLGFTFSPISFMHLAPTAVKEHIKVNNELSYAEFLRKVEHGGISVGTDRFLQQYILNHLDNMRLVYSPKGDALKYLKLQMIKNGVVQSQFEVDITDLKDDVAPQLTIKDKSIEKGQIAFRPILQMGTKSNPIYYMAVGTSGKFNVSDSPRITYRLVEGLGRTNVSLQYTNSAEVAQNNTPEVSETPEGNTTPEEVEYIDGISASEARQQYVDWIIRQLVAQGMPVEQVEEVKSQLTGLSDSDLLATINEARAEAKQELITKFGEKVC